MATMVTAEFLNPRISDRVLNNAEPLYVATGELHGETKAVSSALVSLLPGEPLKGVRR